jgi:hypothetical protein
VKRTIIPPRLVCPLCARDEVSIMPVGDGTLWRYTCLEDGYSWDKKVELESTGYGGIMDDLGLFDDLPLCLSAEVYAEHGVIEDAYKRLRPARYAEIVGIYGHVAHGPKKYTATSFIAQALGHLLRRQAVVWVEGPATGFFDYNRRVGYWALPPGPADGSTLSWERYATDNGDDPKRWELP